MSEQEEELSRRLHAARAARLSAQKTRLLALERAEKLERELREAAETGVKAQIIRSLAARAELRALARRKSAGRIFATAALALVLASATAGLAWFGTQNAIATAPNARQTPVLGVATGDALTLAYSYSVSVPAAR